MRVNEEGILTSHLDLKRSRSNSAEDRTPIKRARPASPSPPLTDDEPPFFIIDTEPSTISDDSHYESFGRGFSYSYIEFPHASTPHLPILGDPLSPQLSPTKSTRCCFNCSSELHISSACPLPRNPALIATNRLAFQAEGGGSGDGGKLGGNDTERVRKMGFAEVFRPGVVSAELRAALGYGYEREGEERRVIDWPWYWRFNEWGYPKGWVMMGDQRREYTHASKSSLYSRSCRSGRASQGPHRPRDGMVVDRDAQGL